MHQLIQFGRLALWLLAVAYVSLAPMPALGQCSNTSASGGTIVNQQCAGGIPTQDRDASRLFTMTSSVSCQNDSYYGAGFPQSQENVVAFGDCGNAAAGQVAECFGQVHDASEIGLAGNSFRWGVPVVDGSWTGSGCSWSQPEEMIIDTYAEGCQGETCCSAGAANACWAHNFGEFNDCYCLFTPIIINMDGGELELTNGAEGVKFDLRPDGIPEQTAWTRRESADAFLVLDRNRNGSIDNGKELFGTATPQPPGPGRNGFKALAVFDTNADARIDDQDRVYSSLRIWTDRNHNGIAEPQELQSLASAGVLSVSLAYRETARRDRHGNLFKYVAEVKLRAGERILTRLAIDVFLVGQDQ